MGYLREVELVSRLDDHENVLRYHCVWQENLKLFIQMDYCLCNLRKFSALEKKRGPLKESLIWDWLFQLSKALAHIHAGGILHLDIKPENILVTFKSGCQSVSKGIKADEPVILKLGDFGHARLKRFDEDYEGGDSAYVAPELLRLGTENGNEENEARENITESNKENNFRFANRSVLTPIRHSSRLSFNSPRLFSLAKSKGSSQLLSSQLLSSRLSLSDRSPLSELPISSPRLSPSTSARDISYLTQSPITFTCDIFSMGLLFFKLCTNYLPKRGSKNWLLIRRCPYIMQDYLEKRKPSLSQNLISLILKMASSKPRDRPSASNIMEIVKKKKLYNSGKKKRIINEKDYKIKLRKLF